MTLGFSKSRVRWKTQFDYIESASKFHNRVRDVFATDNYFNKMRCYQEVNVVDLVGDYPHRNHHVDWYIQELNLVIELHGEQHYQVVNYGNIGYDEAKRNHLRIRDRDNTKQTALTEAGYLYLAISYKEAKNLDAERIKQLIYDSVF